MGIRIAFLLLVTALPFLHGDPGVPPNDICEHATTVTFNAVEVDLPFGRSVTVMGTTAGATADSELGHCTNPRMASAVWYVLDLPAGMADFAASLYQVSDASQLFVFRGNSCGNMSCYATGDVVNYSGASVYFTSPLAGRYYIAVIGLFGESSFFLDCAATPVPPNDVCRDAIAVQMSKTFFGYSLGATAAGELGNCTGSGIAPAVWYVLDLPAGTAFTASFYVVDGSAAGQLAVFRGDSCDNISCYATSDVSDFVSAVYVRSSPAERYYITLIGIFGRQQVQVSIAATPFPPNDLCRDAIAVQLNSVVTGTTTFATADSELGNCRDSGTDSAVWYVLDLPAGMAEFSASVLGVSTTNSDCQLSVFRGDSCSSISCYATGRGKYAVYVRNPPAGRYFIAVMGTRGYIQFNLGIYSPSPVPPNDMCTGAIAVSGGADGTTAGATADSELGNCTNYGLAPAVWYVLDLPDDVSRFMLYSIPGPWACQFSVFRGDSCGNMACYATSDVGNPYVDVRDTAAGRYYIAVIDIAGNSYFDFAIDFVPPVPRNDMCRDALAVPLNSRVTGTTQGAMADGELKNCTDYKTAPAVWYVIDLPAGVEHFVAFVEDGAADFQLSVFWGDSCGNMDCYATSNVSNSEGNASVYLTNPLAGRYYIAVIEIYGIIIGNLDFELGIDATPAPQIPASPSALPATTPAPQIPASPSASPDTTPAPQISASPSASPDTTPAPQIPASPSPSPTATPQDLLAALRNRTATTALSFTAGEIALLAAAAAGTVVVGPVCNTSVVAVGADCGEAVPATIGLETNATPAAHVQCWGAGVQAAVVSACTPSEASLAQLGLTLPPNVAASAILQVLIVDRVDAQGDLQNGQKVSLLLPGASPTGWVAVVVYSGGDTVGVDLISIGGSITAVPGGYLLTAPHTSTFVAYAVDPTAATVSPAPATSDNGWWIGLAAGLGAGIPVAVGVAALAYALYYRRRAPAEAVPAFAPYPAPYHAPPAPHWTPPPTATGYRMPMPYPGYPPAYPQPKAGGYAPWMAGPPPSPMDLHYP